MTTHSQLREAIDIDIRSHSMRRLSSIINNPRHPLHSAAKAERDRRMMGRHMMAREATYSDTGWQKPSVKKDKFGNVIKTKNIAKSLAKSAAKQSAKTQETYDEPMSDYDDAKQAVFKGNAKDKLAKLKAMVSKNEANTPVGQRDMMKIVHRSAHPQGGHNVILAKPNGLHVLRRLKNGKVTDIGQAPSLKQAKHLMGIDEQAVRNEASDDQLHKTLANTKNIDQGIEALKKKHGMSHETAKGHIHRLMGRNEALERDGPKQPDIFGPKGSFGKAASLNPHVQKYMSKRAKDNQDRNKAMDPGAAKKGYGIGVTDVAKADKKAKARGTSMTNRFANSSKMHKAGTRD